MQGPSATTGCWDPQRNESPEESDRCCAIWEAKLLQLARSSADPECGVQENFFQEPKRLAAEVMMWHEKGSLNPVLGYQQHAKRRGCIPHSEGRIWESWNTAVYVAPFPHQVWPVFSDNHCQWEKKALSADLPVWSSISIIPRAAQEREPTVFVSQHCQGNVRRSPLYRDWRCGCQLTTGFVASGLRLWTSDHPITVLQRQT